jgi:hypothetical protein
MGGVQARAPDDDDHVRWSRPPWRGHGDLAGHASARHSERIWQSGAAQMNCSSGEGTRIARINLSNSRNPSLLRSKDLNNSSYLASFVSITRGCDVLMN